MPETGRARVVLLLLALLAALFAVVAFLALVPAAPERPAEPPEAPATEPAPPRPAPAPPKRRMTALTAEHFAPGGEPAREPSEGPLLPGSGTRRSVEVEVRVTAAAGGPPERGGVVLLDALAHRRGTPTRVELEAVPLDAEGVARFEVPPGLPVRFLAGDARGDAALSDRMEFPAAEEPARVELRLGPGIRVRGRVTGRGGGVLRGASLRFESHVEGDAFGFAVTAESGPDGLFELPPLPEQVLAPRPTLHASASGHAQAALRLRVQDLRGTLVEVRLEPASAVAGRVLDPGGVPVEGVVVTLRDRPERTLSGEDGRFRLDALPPSGGDLFVLPEEFAPALVAGLRGDAGDVEVGDVVLRPGGTVTGEVVDLEGRPVAAADVQLTSLVLGRGVRATQTDDQGRFRLAHVGEGEHVVSVVEAPRDGAWSGRLHAEAAGVHADAGPVRIVLTGALTVHVRFLAAADRSAVVVPEVRLTATSADGTPDEYGWAWAGGRIDAVRFEVEHPGTFDVTVEVPGYGPGVARGVTVLPDREMRIDVLFQKVP